MDAKHMARIILQGTAIRVGAALAARADQIDAMPTAFALQSHGLTYPATQIAHIVGSCTASHLRQAHVAKLGVAFAAAVATAAANNAAAVLGLMLECDALS